MQAVNMRAFLIGSGVLAILAAARPAALGQSPGHWSVGDTWKVGAWHGQAYKRGSGAPASQEAYKLRGRLIAVTFQVMGLRQVGSAECYEVQVTFPPEDTGFQRLYKVYYCKATGRLLRITDVSIRADGTAKHIVTDFPADRQGPTLADDVPCMVPLDWPDPARRNVTLPPDSAGSLSQATRHTPVHSTSGTVQQDSVTLTRTSPTTDARVEQLWRTAEPWWREARRFENGQLVAEAVLLEVNGTRLPDAPDLGQ